MTTLAFIDVETTGLDPLVHEVWEVGLVLRDANNVDSEHLWQLPVDLAKADARALTVGRFYERRWQQGTPNHSPINSAQLIQSSLTRWAQHFARMTHDVHLVGANPAFDSAFLQRLLRAGGACPGWSYHLIDIEALALGWCMGAGGDAHAVNRPHPDWAPQPPWKSNELSIAVGVDPGEFNRHSALGDAQWVRAIYDKIMVSTAKGVTMAHGQGLEHDV